MIRAHGEILQSHSEMLHEQGDRILALDRKVDAHHQEFDEKQSRLLTGMDKVMKELENHRNERLRLGAIQNRHTQEIEAIKKHIGLESSNGNGQGNAKAKKPATRSRKKL